MNLIDKLQAEIEAEKKAGADMMFMKFDAKK